MLRLRHDDGFSLTELLVVIAVISMLVSLMVGSVMVVKTRAKVRQNELLLQNLRSAVKQMKAAYQYADPIGLDENGEPLDVAGLEAIDIGWELDPQSDAWGPDGKAKEDLHFNKRLLSFYSVKKRETGAGGHFVDLFGSRIVYTLEERSLPLPDGSGNARIIDEFLVSWSADGEPSTSDDQVVKLGSFSID